MKGLSKKNKKTGHPLLLLIFEVDGDRLNYSQVTNLNIYGEPFNHTGSGTLHRVTVD